MRAWLLERPVRVFDDVAEHADDARFVRGLREHHPQPMEDVRAPALSTAPR